MMLTSVCPPFIIDLLKAFTNRKYGWKGNFASWQDAQAHSLGYNSDVILQKVRNSLLKVKAGQAVYERDSVLFDEIHYSWPLLAGLMFAAAKSGDLRVLDFGGSLGSTYFQNRRFLNELPSVTWNIVEQPHFVEVGKADFETDRLKFYDSFQECIEIAQPNVLVLSSVLQYLEAPYDFLRDILKWRFQVVLVDRTTFVNADKPRLAVQHVPPDITGASYPIWLLLETAFRDFFAPADWTLLADFYEYRDYGGNVYSKGFVYERRI